MSWLAGWSYRKSHIINAQAGAGTNYQKQIIVHYGAGVDGDDDVYCNSHSKTDFGDIRFTDNDGSTLLDYWMESKTDSDNAVFWVEIADSLEAAAQTIYLYYGKADSSTSSNGNSTFLFHDHFDSDLSKWAGDTGNATLSSSIMTLTGAAGVWKIIYGNVTIGPNSAMRVKGQIVNRAAQKGGVIAIRSQLTTDLCDLLYYDVHNKIRTFKNGALTAPETNIDTNLNIYDILWTAASVSFIKNGVEMTASPIITTIPTVNTLRARFDAIGGAGYEVKSDWVLLRKYVSPEPTHGAWGTETAAPVTVPSLGATTRRQRKPRRKRLPLPLLIAVKDYLEMKLAVD